MQKKIVDLTFLTSEVKEILKNAKIHPKEVLNALKTIENIQKSSLQVFLDKARTLKCPNLKFAVRLIENVLSVNENVGSIKDLSKFFDNAKTQTTISLEKAANLTERKRNDLNQHLTAAFNQLKKLQKIIIIAPNSSFLQSKISCALDIIAEFKEANFNEFQEQKEAMFNALEEILITSITKVDNPHNVVSVQ